MAESEFDGVRLDEKNLPRILRDGAHGSVPASDPNGQLNPTSWLLSLAHKVAASPLRDALAQAITGLLASGDDAEMDLAVELQRQVAVVDGPTLWSLFFDDAKADRLSAAGRVATAMLVLLGRGVLSYDLKVRDLLLGAGVPRGLMKILLMLAGALDGPWVLQHPELFFGNSDDDTELLISYATTTLDSVALESFARELGDELAARGRPLPAATLDNIKQWVESRKKAEATSS